MIRGITSRLLLQHRLTPTLLDTLTGCGAQTIEVFAARHHFDYTDARAVREMATWFRSNDVAATMHMPLYPDAHWSRHTAPSLNLIAAAKAGRIAAQDEAKRALEAAEQAPFKTCTLQLGLKEDRWDTRALDDALTAMEHLQAFAAPLGVRLLLANSDNDVATPEHIVEIVRMGHFDGVGFSLDVGSANLLTAEQETTHAPGRTAVELAFTTFGERFAEVRLNDNHGMRHERLWPGEGSVDWKSVAAQVNALPSAVAVVDVDPPMEESAIKARAEQAWALLRAEDAR